MDRKEKFIHKSADLVESAQNLISAFEQKFVEIDLIWLGNIHKKRHLIFPHDDYFSEIQFLVIRTVKFDIFVF